MTQNQETPVNAAQAQQQAQGQQHRIAIPRPEAQRTESSLPGHLRPSVINVPVTPGIHRGAYEEEPTDLPPTPQGAGAGYFARRINEHEIAQSPGTVGLDETGSVDKQLEVGADASKDYMRRLSTAVTGAGRPVGLERKDSIADIRDKFPNLSLSGNIISATFTIPHLLKYTKGSGEKGTTGSWVSSDPNFCKRSGADVMMRNQTGSKTPPGTVGAFRFVFVPLLRRRPMESHGCRLDWRD